MERISFSSKYPLFSEELFLVGSSFLVFYASLILVQTVFLILGANLQNAGTFLACIITLTYFVTASRKIQSKPKALIAWLLFIFVITSISGLLSSFFVDVSWDGRDYHQKAIRQLIGNWNPVYQELEPKEVYYNSWLNHYPRGPWLSSASIVKLTGDIEVGKIFNLLLILSVFALSFSYFIATPSLNPWQSLAISLFLAANPVSVYQSLSYYQDGQVSSTFTLLLLLALFSLQKTGWILYLTIISTVIIGLNIKFTGTAYFAILLAGLLITNMIHKKNLRLTLPLMASVLIGALIGIFVVGFNPYVTNTLRYGHPFYPVYGGSQLNKEYIISNQMPSNFTNQNQIQKLYLSIFSPSENVYGYATDPLKNPFSFDVSEIKVFKLADVRIGGWGPLFGAAIIVSAISLISVFLVSTGKGLLGLGLSGLVFCTSLLNSEAWWARYSPQLSLIPVIILTITWIAGNRKLNLLGYLLSGIIFLNIFLVSGAYVAANFLKTMRYRTEMANLSKSGNEILIYYGALDSITVELDKYHIPYKTVSDIKSLPCPKELMPEVFYSFKDCSKKQIPLLRLDRLRGGRFKPILQPG